MGCARTRARCRSRSARTFPVQERVEDSGVSGGFGEPIVRFFGGARATSSSFTPAVFTTQAEFICPIHFPGVLPPDGPEASVSGQLSGALSCASWFMPITDRGT